MERGIAAGYAVSGLTLTAEGLASPTAPQGDVTLTGQIDGKPVRASGKVVSGEGATQVEGLALEIGPNRLNGALTLALALRPAARSTSIFPTSACSQHWRAKRSAAI